MKTPTLTFHADRGRRVVSYACMSASTVAAAIGFAVHIQDLLIAGVILLILSASTLLLSDSIVIDGRNHVIRRRTGVWPLLQERSRPFSEVDHVCIEEIPAVEPDGSEYKVSRLSIVRKYGTPIVLANSHDAGNSLKDEAEALANLIGVEARTAGPDMRCQVAML